MSYDEHCPLNKRQSAESFIVRLCNARCDTTRTEHQFMPPRRREQKKRVSIVTSARSFSQNQNINMPPSPGDVLSHTPTLWNIFTSSFLPPQPSLHISMYVHPMQLNTSWIIGWEVQAWGRHSCCCPLREETPWGDPCERGRSAQLSHFIQRPNGSLPGSGQGLHQVKEQQRLGQGQKCIERVKRD